MTYRLLYPIALLWFLFGLQSCKTREKLVYFQNSNQDSTAQAVNQFTPTFKVDDFLSIVVTALEPETVIPFNLVPVTRENPGASGYANGNPASLGYLIDTDGNILFPVIGKIHIAGLNRKDAVELIQNKLKDYLTLPGVQIQILNYKVTVLGDVQNPGTFKIPNERITILEALGLAGDLNITGERINVLVIREENGKKQEYRIDLTSKDLFSSPIYYLHQNDVVYIEPNKAARSTSTLWRTSGGIFISLTSLVITTVTLITRK